MFSRWPLAEITSPFTTTERALITALTKACVEELQREFASLASEDGDHCTNVAPEPEWAPGSGAKTMDVDHGDGPTRYPRQD